VQERPQKGEKEKNRPAGREGDWRGIGVCKSPEEKRGFKEWRQNGESRAAFTPRCRAKKKWGPPSGRTKGGESLPF